MHKQNSPLLALARPPLSNCTYGSHRRRVGDSFSAHRRFWKLQDDLRLPDEMQDFQPLHGRIFCGGGGTTDGGGGRAELRRIVGYPAMSPRQQQPPPLPAKCPRCESVNTKFCYYNNYNLSQPRHFCKSCRRYWTMGGVLRNVPVGGGCRKSKRASSKPSKPTLDAADKDQLRRRRPSSAFRSSSDGSSLSASVHSTTSTSLPDPALLANRISTANPNPQYDQLPDVDAPLCSAPDVFQDPAAGVLTGTPTALLGFGFHDPPPAEEKGETIRPEFADPTIRVDARQSSGDGDGIPSLDWSGQVDPTFYDLTCAVDPSSYWNPSHWSDPDPSLYLP